MNKTECIVVSGGFDPIHVGHLKMFKEASELAPKLIVIVNNDNFLIEKKGYVFMPLAERIEIIEGFGVVDMVVESIDADLTVCKTLTMAFKRRKCNTFLPMAVTEIVKMQFPRQKYVEQNNITMKFNVGGGKIQSSSSLVVERNHQTLGVLQNV